MTVAIVNDPPQKSDPEGNLDDALFLVVFSHLLQACELWPPVASVIQTGQQVLPKSAISGKKKKKKRLASWKPETVTHHPVRLDMWRAAIQSEEGNYRLRLHTFGVVIIIKVWGQRSARESCPDRNIDVSGLNSTHSLNIWILNGFYWLNVSFKRSISLKILRSKNIEHNTAAQQHAY